MDCDYNWCYYQSIVVGHNSSCQYINHDDDDFANSKSDSVIATQLGEPAPATLVILAVIEQNTITMIVDDTTKMRYTTNSSSTSADNSNISTLDEDTQVEPAY